MTIQVEYLSRTFGTLEAVKGIDMASTPFVVHFWGMVRQKYHSI